MLPVLKKVTKASWWDLRKRSIYSIVFSLVMLGAGIGVGWGAKTLASNHVSSSEVTSSSTTALSDASRPVFLVVGDSLTQLGGDVGSQGWSARLQQAYIRDVDVLNRGFAGWNTQDFRDKALPIISSELRHAFAPALMTLWFGANDAALTTGPSAAQHVPIETYRDNLIYILMQFRELAPQAKIILISPQVVDDGPRQRIQGANEPLDRSNEQAGMYAAACANASRAVDGVTFLDMYSYLNTTYPTAAARQTVLGDGLHLTAEGNCVVFEKINQQLRALLPSSLIDKSQIS